MLILMAGTCLKQTVTGGKKDWGSCVTVKIHLFENFSQVKKVQQMMES